MTSGRRSRERANIIPGKRHLFDGGRQRCTEERTTSISSRRHQFGGDRTIVRRGGTMMGRPFGNTSSSIRSALRDRFMLGGLKLGQSLSHPDLLPPKHGQIALVSISRWRVQADNPVKDSGRARTSRMAVDLHGEFMDFGAGSKVRQTAPVGQGSIFIALSSRQIEFASSFHFSLWQTKWQESGRHAFSQPCTFVGA